MAVRLFFPNLHRIRVAYIANFVRGISSNTLPAPPTKELTSPNEELNDNGDLKSQLVRVSAFPQRSARTVLQNWVDSGHKVSIYDLRHISRKLLNLRRYKHALEVLIWMEAQDRFQISASDYANRVNLTIKVQTLNDAEEYFASIPDTTAQKVAFLPLLYAYVRERDNDKAEALMTKMSGLGLIVSPHPYNSMMKLYLATSQFKKVVSVVQQMKENKIPINFMSYNIWMTASAEVSGPPSAELVYKEMLDNKDVEVGWSTLSTLATIYLKEGLIEKATWALRKAETKLSTSNHLGFFFLITLYTSLKDKNGVLRLWEASKAIKRRITCANYMCILLSLVKLGSIEEAENIFKEWESNCGKYDIRVSNVLLGAYMRNGLVEKAESLHHHTLRRGGRPNYKTWEILMEGWVKTKDMNKAITAMKKCLSMLEGCKWKPSSSVIVAIAEYYENHANFKDAKEYLKAMRRFGLASLSVYKPLLRMHVANKRPSEDLLKMMQKDKFDMDDETLKLIQALRDVNCNINVE